MCNIRKEKMEGCKFGCTFVLIRECAKVHVIFTIT